LRLQIDGCDLMICGQNYHGGDVQNGCGKNFKWSGAPAYVANAGANQTAEERSAGLLPPQEIRRELHLVAEGVPWPCDECGKDIVGPRISCIQCPSFSLCLPCSMTMRGQQQGQQQQQQQRQGHNASHICTVIFKSSQW
jgi:hypothetical protein